MTFKRDEATEDGVIDFSATLRSSGRAELAKDKDLSLTLEVNPDPVREERVDLAKDAHGSSTLS